MKKVRRGEGKELFQGYTQLVKGELRVQPGSVWSQDQYSSPPRGPGTTGLGLKDLAPP
jgi:hypothetical protein